MNKQEMKKAKFLYTYKNELVYSYREHTYSITADVEWTFKEQHKEAQAFIDAMLETSEKIEKASKTTEPAYIGFEKFYAYLDGDESAFDSEGEKKND